MDVEAGKGVVCIYILCIFNMVLRAESSVKSDMYGAIVTCSRSQSEFSMRLSAPSSFKITPCHAGVEIGMCERARRSSRDVTVRSAHCLGDKRLLAPVR